MLKTIFILLALFISTENYSQFFIGYSVKDSKTEIKSRFPNAEVDEGYLDKYYYIQFYGDSLSTEFLLYYENNICTQALIIPHGSEMLTAFITAFNSHYVVESKTKWIAYVQGTTFSIELKYDDDKKVYTLIMRLITD